MSVGLLADAFFYADVFRKKRGNAEWDSASVVHVVGRSDKVHGGNITWFSIAFFVYNLLAVVQIRLNKKLQIGLV